MRRGERKGGRESVRKFQPGEEGRGGVGRG